MAPLGTLEEDEAVDVFAEQAAALVAGGVDLIWIETMSHLSEITAAIRGARQASPTIPVIATMTFDTRGHTMMGVSPEQAARALLAAGADAIGGNCGNGPDELLPVIERMHAVAPDAVLVAKSNAGMPELVDLQAVYRADPATMAEAAMDFRRAGARIIGACCGSTPAHLAAMAEALRVARRLTVARRRPGSTGGRRGGRGRSVLARPPRGARRPRSGPPPGSPPASAGRRTAARRRRTGGRRG